MSLMSKLLHLLSLGRHLKVAPSNSINNKDTSMENVPDELLLNIFIRLFSKQLAQMRCVSKSWNALLSQPSFKKSHLYRSIHNNDQILLVFYCKVCSFDRKPFTAHPSRSPHLQLTKFNLRLPVTPKFGRTESIKIIGAVNGLICSTYDDSVIHIWNPSLSAMITLPSDPLPSHHSYEINLRFGFDPKANDYKVVKIMGMTHMELASFDNIWTEWLQIGVYSMRKESWELINERFPVHIRGIFDEDSACVDGHDGHLHWVCYHYGENKYTQTIVAFNLGSETFREIPLPDSIPAEICENLIGVLDRKLCVMSWVEKDACDVWVMEEYGVAESWVKRHVFSPGIYIKDSYGFTSHKELLVRDRNRRFVLYDPIANKTKIFKNICNRKLHRPHKIVEYVDSLVWVTPGERDMADGGEQN